MDDRQLIAELRSFGIDATNFSVLSLLPLCHVAWADGEVQAEERELILDRAGQQVGLNDEGLRILENWLTFPPTHEYLTRGHDLLVELAKRRGRVSLDASTLDEIIAVSQDVAAAAGGLWGFMKVHAAEKEALSVIAEALHLRGDVGWGDVLDLDDEAPSVDATVSYHTEEVDRPTDAWVSRARVGAERCPVPVDGLTVGRGRSNNVQILESPRVSREHCRIYLDPDTHRFYVRDLGSTTGTRVNGERIVERRLFGGETIEVGGIELVFDIDRGTISEE